MMKKAVKYLGAENLVEKWKLLDGQQKGYAKYLVETYKYPVNIALQRSYIFGFDPWPYDYRTGETIRETADRGRFFK